MHDFSFWMSTSSLVASCMVSIDVHPGTDVLKAIMFMSMPVISRFLFSVWLLQDNQSTMYRSGQGLCIMCTLYW